MENHLKHSSLQKRTDQFLHSPHLFGLTLLIILASYAFLHYLASYTLPVPWPDEAHFLWQAEGFAEHGSLFAPELNPDRTILWMPPGYMLILGGITKIFGLSLTVARTCSLLTMIGVIALMAALARRFGHPWLAVLPIALFFLGPPGVAAGNVARMEAMLLLFVLGGFYFLQRERIAIGLGILALTPLIHPNGAFFLVAGGIAGIILLILKGRWQKPTRGELVFVVAVILAWSAYAAYVGIHWHDFLQDMAMQFQRKLDRPYWQDVVLARSKGLLIATSLASIYCLIRKMPALLLVGIGVPAWWIGTTGGEMWYSIFNSLAYCSALLLFVFVAAQMIADRVWERFRSILWLVVPVYACYVLTWNLLKVSEPQPLLFVDSRPWYNMSASAEPYINRDDILSVQATFATRIPFEHKASIEFFPEGDAFFFSRRRSENVLFSCPLFCERNSDWYLFHLSSRTPPALSWLGEVKLQKLRIQAADLPRYLIHTRGTSDRWYLIPGKAARGLR